MTTDSGSLQINKLAIASDTIASGTTTAEIDLQGGTLIGIITPASIASTTATIQMAPTSAGTYVTVKDPLGTITTAGGNISMTIASSGYYVLPLSVTAGLRFIKLVTGSTETNKTFTFVYRAVQ